MMCRDPECGTCQECQSNEAWSELRQQLIDECDLLGPHITDFTDENYICFDGLFYIATGNPAELVISHLVCELKQTSMEWHQDLDHLCSTHQLLHDHGHNIPCSEVYKYPAWFVAMRLEEIPEENRAKTTNPY